MLRAALKGLLSRKLRMVLSGLAVVLGVMFVAGAFVVTDTPRSLLRRALLRRVCADARAGGAPVQYAAHGRPAGPAPVDVPLDLHQVAASWISTPESELRAVFGQPIVFAHLAGIASGGLRDLLDQAPLDEYPDESVLYLRRD